MRKLTRVKRITCANKDSTADLIIEYVGDVIIIDDNGKLGCLRGVLFAPQLADNLLVLRKLSNKNFEGVFLFDKVIFRDRFTKEIFKTGFYNGRFWRVNFSLPLLEYNERKANKIIRKLNLKTGGSTLKRKRIMLTDVEIGGSKTESKRIKLSEYDLNEDDRVGDQFEMKISDL